MTLNDENAITLLEELIRLNNFDNEIRQLFGQSNDDGVLDWSISNLFKVFLFLSELDDFSDAIYEIVFSEENSIEDSEDIYKELMAIKIKNGK